MKIKFNESSVAGIAGIVNNASLGPLAKIDSSESKEKETKEISSEDNKKITLEKTGSTVTESEEVDYEGAMAKSQLRNIIEDSQELMSMITDESQLPAWIQSKLTIAEHNLDASLDYMKSEEHSDDKESLTEAKASDVKGNGPIANMAREYLEKYPTFFTFRVNEHIKLLEKTLGSKQKDVIKVIVGGLEEMVRGEYGSNRAWTGTTVVAFTEDKIYAAQKGFVFKEYVKTLNRDKIDDVTITTGMIYAKFSMEDLHVGIIHKKALPELKEFFEKYIDSKVKMKSDSKIDKEAAKLSESFKLIKFGMTINEALALPKKDEEKDEFISRFMSSKQAKIDFPENKQRVAVAFSQWERANKDKTLKEESQNDEFLDEDIDVLEFLNMDLLLSESKDDKFISKNDPENYIDSKAKRFSWGKLAEFVFGITGGVLMSLVLPAAYFRIPKSLTKPDVEKFNRLAQLSNNDAQARKLVQEIKLETKKQPLDKNKIKLLFKEYKQRMDILRKEAKAEMKSKQTQVIDSKAGAQKMVTEENLMINEAKERHPMLVKYGAEGFNKPKRTPDHKTKSHLVVAKKGDDVKVVRFGAQGVKGSPKKEGESESYKKRRQGFVARHKAQNPSGMKDKFSALYWANKVKW